MPVTMTTRETNRLHRWAMWRMTVNEGIISCIRENGTTRVIYPESTSDTSSVNSTVDEFHEFPFITPEQLSLARKLNLREKYGSSHGLSDDTYFIFGLPRITVGKDVPEVTSTGTRSVYGSLSDFGTAMELNNNSNNHSNNHSPRGMVHVPAEANTASNLTYSELGQTPDVQSLVSHNDSEVQRINGFREDWKNPVSPVPRLNLYSIQEEFNNNNNRSNNNTNYTKETTDRYSSDRYYNTPAQSYDVGDANDRFLSDRYHSSSYNPSRANAQYSSNRYHTVETTNRFSSDRYHNGSGQSFNAGDVNDHYSSSQYNTSSAPSYNARVTTDGYSATQFNRSTAPSQNASRDIYPPFSDSRQLRHSPMRQSYSSPPTSPRQNYSPSPTFPRQGYSLLPTSPRQSYSPSPRSPRQSYSPLPSSPRESYSPSLISPRQSGPPSPSLAREVGSPGYGNKMRPTNLLTDGEAERVKRQAYYDWSTPTKERFMPDFASYNRHS